MDGGSAPPSPRGAVPTELDNLVSSAERATKAIDENISAARRRPLQPHVATRSVQAATQGHQATSLLSCQPPTSDVIYVLDACAYVYAFARVCIYMGCHISGVSHHVYTCPGEYRAELARESEGDAGVGERHTQRVAGEPRPEPREHQRVALGAVARPKLDEKL